MDVYRQAVVKLLNSLSRVSDVVKLETVDEAKTIIRFNLKDVGWEPEDWDKILAVYPYATRPDSQMFDLLAAATLTPLPFVRGDWFAFTASQPPLYDELLRCPTTSSALQKQTRPRHRGEHRRLHRQARRLPEFRRVAATTA